MLRESRPLYVRAAKEIELLIKQEGLSSSHRLPPETSLARGLGISRSTVREALHDLELRGLIRRVHGQGTVIADPPPILSGLTVLESLESLARRQGWHCGTRAVRIKDVAAPDKVADLLHVPRGSRLTYLRRIKTKDSHPVSLMETWLPPEILTAEELRKRFVNSISDLLVTMEPRRLGYVVSEVGAVAVDSSTASALSVRPGSPVVLLSELAFTAQEERIAFSNNFFVPKAVRLEVVRMPLANGKS